MTELVKLRQACKLYKSDSEIDVKLFNNTIVGSFGSPKEKC